MPDEEYPDEDAVYDVEDATIGNEEIVAMALAATNTSATPDALANFQIDPVKVQELDDVVEMWKDVQVDITNSKEDIESLVKSFQDKVGIIAPILEQAKEFYANCPKFSSKDEYQKNIKKKFEETDEAKQKRERGKSLLGAFSRPLD